MNETAQTNATATVIFDGECAFCQARIEELKALDVEQSLEFVARQDPRSEQRFPQINAIDLDEGILLIDSAGRVHVAADGMYEIFKRLPSRRGFTWLYEVPVLKQAFQFGYYLTAKNRKLLGQVCTKDSCKRK